NDLPDHSFDAILCIATIYYLPNLEDFFTQVRRLLKPGGVLVINNFDREVIRYYFGHELQDLDARYGAMYSGAAFRDLLEQQLGATPEHYLQSPVRLKGLSRFTLPLRLPFSPAVIIPASPRLQGVYNYYVVQKLDKECV
ncbi:MAG: SAM-dependent methyltransferase, partial [Verrucomicrobiales bacterium]